MIFSILFISLSLEKIGWLKANQLLQQRVSVYIFVLLLILWISGGYLNINPTEAAFVGLSLLLLTGVLTWQDIINEKV